MDRKSIFEIIGHMNDFGYWQDCCIFFNGKSYSDYDRRFINDELILHEEVTLPKHNDSYNFFTSPEMAYFSKDDEESYGDDFDEEESYWYEDSDNEAIVYICSLSEDEKKRHGASNTMEIILFERMGGMLYSDCDEPLVETLAPYAMNIMYAYDIPYYADGKIAFLALNTYLKKYNMIAKSAVADQVYDCSGMLVIEEIIKSN